MLLEAPNVILMQNSGIKNKQIVSVDVNANELLPLIDRKGAKIVVAPIRGQGYLFGRGNQQVSPKIIWRVGPQNIIVIATPNKIFSLMLKPLLIDTEDEDMNQMLRGYVRVATS